MDFLLFFTLVFSMTGAKILSVSLGSVEMSPFRALMTVQVLLLAYAALRYKRKVIISRNVRQEYSVFFYLAWLVYAFISLAWARNTGAWVRNIFFLTIGFLSIIVLVNNVNTITDVKKLLYAFNAGVFAQSLIGWYEVVTGNYFFLSRSSEDYVIYSRFAMPVAMQGNTNNFATLMYFGVAAAVTCCLLSKKKLFKILNLIAAAGYSLLIIKSTSRANILALVIFAAAWLVLYRRRKTAAALIVVLAIPVLLILPDLSGSLTGFDFSRGSDSVRLGLIKNGFEFLYDTCGFGVGAGQVESWMGSAGQAYSGNITNMHNWWMEIFTSYGIFIFIGYICFYCLLFKTFYRTFKNSEMWEEKAICGSLCALMSGFVLSSVSSSSNISSEWMWVFWAICIACQGIMGNDPEITEGKA